MLYFAYGSNLNHFQMKRRCKESRFIKKYELKNFKLTFRSKYRSADIEKKKILLFRELYLKFQRMTKKNWMFMKNFQLFIKKYIFFIIIKKL